MVVKNLTNSFKKPFIMEDNEHLHETSIASLLEAKLQLQIENLRLEQQKLKPKNWYRKPEWISAILPGTAVLLVGIGTVCVAFLTGYINTQKAANEATNTLLTLKRDTLLAQIDSFKNQKASLIAENARLRQNESYVQGRIVEYNLRLKQLDSIIRFQAGTAKRKGQYAYSLLQQVFQLRGKNQELEATIEKYNTSTLFTASSLTNSSLGATFPVGPSFLSSSGQPMNLQQLLSSGQQFGTFSIGTLTSDKSGLMYLDSAGRLVPVNSGQLSSPLYIQDTSSAIYKVIHGKN